MYDMTSLKQIIDPEYIYKCCTEMLSIFSTNYLMFTIASNEEKSLVPENYEFTPQFMGCHNLKEMNLIFGI